MSVTFGTTLPPILPMQTQFHLAVMLEKFGFDNVWLPDHTLFPDGTEAPDCWTLMAVIASRTRRIKIGPAVTDPHRHHPAVFAQRVATLDQLSKGRMVIGLGSGEGMNLEPFGISWENRKVGRVKEFIQVVRGLLDSPEPFSFEGDFFQLRRARLGVRPYRGRRIPIYLAALGPMMARLAGRVADGWYPMPIPQEYYRGYFQPLADAARKAGRDPEQIERAAMAVVALDPEGTLTRQEVLRQVRPHAGSLVWPPVVKQMGLDFDPPQHLTEDFVTVNPCDPESLKRYAEYQRWLPDELLLPFLDWGSEQDIERALRGFIDAGATHVNVFNASLEPLEAFAVLAARIFPRLNGRPAPAAARLASAVLPVLRKTGVLSRLIPTPTYQETRGVEESA